MNADKRGALHSPRDSRPKWKGVRSSVALAVAAFAVLTVGATSTVAAPGGNSKGTALRPPGQRPLTNSRAQKPPTNLATLAATTTAALAPAATGTPGPPLKMKVLVVTADGQTGAAQTDLLAIKTFLGQIGIPYDVLVATQTQLTSSLLTDGTTGNYQAVILESGSLVYQNPSGVWESALDPTEWQILWDYEAQFKVRQVTWYTYPFGTSDNFNYGLTPDPGYADTQIAPLQGSLTSQGKALFDYLNPTSQITFKSAWVYLPQIADTTGNTTALLTTANNEVIASTHKYLDGRENLAITADNAWFIVHSELLSYGLINWATRGIFLGERHVNVDAQVDDLFIDDDQWDPICNCDTNPAVAPYRMSGDDYNKAISWQAGLRASKTVLANFRLEFPYNGEGATGTYVPDTLTPAVKANSAPFGWINHTFSHANLDFIDYTTAKSEILKNHKTAKDFGFANYFKDSLVQPDISGLANPNFFQAALDTGIHYLISDASRPEWANPSPNAGFYSAYQPSILIIPRRANNLFYNLRTPAQWVDEFNCYYSWGQDATYGDPSNQADSGTCRDVNGRSWRYYQYDQTYQQILDKESNDLLGYMLRWDLDPWMFHQPNLGTYDGTHSLLGDLLDMTMQKYAAAYNLPVRSLQQHTVGQLMANRMAYDRSGASAVLTPCKSLTLNAQQSGPVPITGVKITNRTETYGSQRIATAQVTAGTPLTIAVTC